MAREKEPTIEAREIPSSSSSSRWPLNDDVEAGGKQESLPLPQWPTEPQPLEQSKLSYWVGIVMDVGLMIAPLLLIMKTALVIYAYRLDFGKSGLPGGGTAVSNLTLKLIEFNSQVCRSLFTMIEHALIRPAARHFIHHNIHHDCRDRRSTLCTIQGPDRCLSDSIGAVPS